MEAKRPILPEERGYDQAYQLAYRMASEQLARVGDIEAQCRRSGTQLQVTNARRAIRVRYLNQWYIITLPDVEISRLESSEKIPLRDKLLILHYFITARGTPLAQRLITFRELPEGSVYYPTFVQRVTKPILNYFGLNPERLLDAGQKLGGCKADYGDAAVTLDAFPRVPVTIVLWRGDDGLPPEGTMLFDATIGDYLPTEDIAVLAETIAWKLVRY